MNFGADDRLYWWMIHCICRILHKQQESAIIKYHSEATSKATNKALDRTSTEHQRESKEPHDGNSKKIISAA